MYRRSAEELRGKLEASVGEIQRGNHVIQQLQAQRRTDAQALKHKSAVIRQQERVVVEKEQRMAELQQQVCAPPPPAAGLSPTIAAAPGSCTRRRGIWRASASGAATCAQSWRRRGGGCSALRTRCGRTSRVSARVPCACAVPLLRMRASHRLRSDRYPAHHHQQAGNGAQALVHARRAFVRVPARSVACTHAHRAHVVVTSSRLPREQSTPPLTPPWPPREPPPRPPPPTARSLLRALPAAQAVCRLAARARLPPGTPPPAAATARCRSAWAAGALAVRTETAARACRPRSGGTRCDWRALAARPAWGLETAAAAAGMTCTRCALQCIPPSPARI